MKSRMRSLWLAGLAVPVITACSVTPVYQRPEAPVPVQWDAASPAQAGEAISTEWWRKFASEELNALMTEALEANHDLGAAAQRIQQARASAQIARSRLFPAVDLSASAVRDKHEGSAHTEEDQAALSVSYELDLWGGNRAATNAANARVAATQYDHDAIGLILQSDVASNYFQVLALRDRLNIANQNLAAARQLMELVEVRFRNGAATALDVAQQRTTLLSIESDIPNLQQSLQETLTALAILLGRAPQGFVVSGQSLDELTLPEVNADAPATLLERRPDVRAAEESLIAANADIGSARAALFPSVGLSASTAITGALTGGSSTISSFAASLVQTLFDGGTLRGQVALSEAARAELVESYVQAVLISLKEVEDSLSAVSTSETRAQLLTETAAQAREAYRLAGVRYREGVEDLLTLLDVQRTQLSAEDNLVQARLARYSAAVSLFKSLGGGWQAGA
jgi:outer membrane protein, multidrug efflux system